MALFLSQAGIFEVSKTWGGGFLSATKEIQVNLLNTDSWSRLSLNTLLQEEKCSRSSAVMTSSL